MNARRYAALFAVGFITPFPVVFYFEAIAALLQPVDWMVTLAAALFFGPFMGLAAVILGQKARQR